MSHIALIFCCALTITLTSAQFYGYSYGTNYVDPYVTERAPTFSNLNTYTSPYAYPYYNYARYWDSYLSNPNSNLGYNGYNGYNGNGYGYNYNNQGYPYAVTTGKK